MAEETTVTQNDNGDSPAPEGAPDVSEPWAALEQKLDARFSQLEERLPEPQPEGPAPSLIDLLTEDDDLPSEDELMRDYGEQPNTQEVDPQAAELAAIKNYLIEKEEGERTNAINSLEEKYPDIREHLPAIADHVDRIADELGGDVPLTPRLVELAYKSVKADAASAAETPAEEARKRGASLETEAGAGQASEESEDENIMRRIAQARDSQSVF